MLKLRYDADAVVGFLFALADGIALQMLSDPERDHADVIAAGTVARAAPARRSRVTPAHSPRSRCISHMTGWPAS